METTTSTTTAPPVDPPVQYRGDLGGGELLLTVHADGTHEVAFRADQWDTWDPPVRLRPVAPTEVSA